MAAGGQEQAAGASALSASASAPAVVFAHEDDYMLTQTQPVASQCFRHPVAQDQDVRAKLVSLTEINWKYLIKKDQKQVRIGRHPDNEIQVMEKRVSGFHLRIYRDDAFRYFIEELSNNGCYINSHFMKKGDTKSLQHGDEISIGVLSDGINEKFAAYHFIVADCESAPVEAAPEAIVVAATSTTVGSRETQTSATSSRTMLAGPGHSHHVTEQWVRDNWDTRTVLGSGNFSEVRLGVEAKAGNDKRAVKIIDKKKFLQFQTKRETHLTLSSEADVLVDLKHDGIVGFFDWFETDNHLYLVMELLSGGDLLGNILEHGCFTENVARRLFKELCTAVKYLHDKNIVHRDLKPENILLTNKDRITMNLKIADFGLARKNMKSRDCRTFCGTPHYFAPEVINTFRDSKSDSAAGYGKQADMWSLGVILYIMLSGIPPFEEDGLYEQILEGKYEFDVREWTTVSPEAKELVKRLMTVNPKDRLSISEACEHRWFRFHGICQSSCQSPPRSRPLPPTFAADVQPLQPMSDVQAEPTAKRRRTEDAPMSEVTEHSPLGA